MEPLLQGMSSFQEQENAMLNFPTQMMSVSVSISTEEPDDRLSAAQTSACIKHPLTDVDVDGMLRCCQEKDN